MLRTTRACLPASTLTARFGAIARPLPYGRGSDQSRDRKGALAAGNSTISRGQRPRRRSRLRSRWCFRRRRTVRTSGGGVARRALRVVAILGAYRTSRKTELCVLAYHLLATVEKTFLDQGIHTSWASLREQLATHQIVTVVLPTSDGHQICIRKATTPEPEHQRIYQVLRIPGNLLDPVRNRPIVTERTCK